MFKLIGLVPRVLSYRTVIELVATSAIVDETWVQMPSSTTIFYTYSKMYNVFIEIHTQCGVE